MRIINIIYVFLLVLNSCAYHEEKNIIDLVQSPLTANSNFDEVAMPEIEIDQDFFDFGEIQQNKSVNREFIVRNIGNAPLIIRSVKGSCGCTVPEWPREPVLSGSQAIIKVTFNSGTKQGKQNQRVTLVTNAIPSTKVLTITGTILVPLNN
tara:strand:- start:368 stop:820 length:453 start_codon:yes stop_codon:yes gene_type:complete